MKKGVRLEIFQGGQSAGWFGEGVPDYIILHETATFQGLGIKVGWPPEVKGDVTSYTFEVDPFVGETIGGADHVSLTVTEATKLYAFISADVADIYIKGHIYRPSTTIRLAP